MPQNDRFPVSLFKDWAQEQVVMLSLVLGKDTNSTVEFFMIPILIAGKSLSMRNTCPKPFTGSSYICPVLGFSGLTLIWFT